MSNPRRQITFAITTASVLALSILAFVAIAIWAPASDRVELLGGAGILSAVILASMRALFGIVTDDDDEPRTGGGTALLIAVVVAAATLPTVTACASTYEPHAIAGTVLRDMTNTAGDVIREVRMDELRRAGRAVERVPDESDADFRARVGIAVDVAAAEYDEEHADLITGQRAAAHATNAYVDGTLAATQGLEERAVVERFAGDAIRLSNELIELMRRHGLPDIPSIPPGVAGFLGGFLTGGAR